MIWHGLQKSVITEYPTSTPVSLQPIFYIVVVVILKCKSNHISHLCKTFHCTKNSYSLSWPRKTFIIWVPSTTTFPHFPTSISDPPTLAYIPFLFCKPFSHPRAFACTVLVIWILLSHMMTCPNIKCSVKCSRYSFPYVVFFLPLVLSCCFIFILALTTVWKHLVCLFTSLLSASPFRI